MHTMLNVRELTAIGNSCNLAKRPPNVVQNDGYRETDGYRVPAGYRVQHVYRLRDVWALTEKATGERKFGSFFCHEVAWTDLRRKIRNETTLAYMNVRQPGERCFSSEESRVLACTIYFFYFFLSILVRDVGQFAARWFCEMTMRDFSPRSFSRPYLTNATMDFHF